MSEKGIQVISSDSLLLGGQPKINIIVNILTYLVHPSDRINRTSILQLLHENNIINDKNDLYKANLQDILEANNIKLNRIHLNSMPLYELCEEVMRSLGLAKINDPYLQFFLEEVYSYTSKKGNSIHEFIKWWEDRKQKASIIIPENTNAVRIMTIHRAKGLEFPVVLFPFANWKIKNTKNSFWIDVEEKTVPGLPAAIITASSSLEETEHEDLYAKEKNDSLLDNINLLYVALTRPVERLYIYSGMPGKTPTNFSTISDVFGLYYQQKGLWSESKTIYVTGKQHTKKQKPETRNQKPLLHSIHSSKWQDHLAIRSNATEVWDMNSTESAQDHGLVIHKTFSYIKTEEDIESAVQAVINMGLLENKEKKSVIEKIKRIIHLPSISSYFQQGLEIKNETDIVLTNGKVMRPDRICINNSETVIIDYKTGKRSPDHIKQVQDYANAMQEMGFKEVKKYLIYIEDEEVVEL